MAFWENILAGGVGEMAKGVGALAKDIRTAITGEEPLNAEQRARLQEQLTAMEAAAMKAAADFDTAQMTGQVEINKIEAASNSPFARNWRPAVGWVCVWGLFYTFGLKPMLPWCAEVGAIIVGRVSVIPPLPEIPMGDLIVLLGGMIGLGTMRTVEKLKGGSR